MANPVEQVADVNGSPTKPLPVSGFGVVDAHVAGTPVQLASLLETEEERGTAPNLNNQLIWTTKAMATGMLKIVGHCQYYEMEDVELVLSSDLPILKVEIYDMTNRLINLKTAPENSINVSDLKSGNYILKIYTEKGFTNIKMIKE